MDIEKSNKRGPQTKFKKRNIYNLFLILLLLVFIILDISVIMPKFLKYEEIITASFFILLSFVAISLLGIRKDISSPKKESVKYAVICVFVGYLLISYLLGIFLGFLRNSYSQEVTKLIQNVICPIIIIIFSELTRYVIINANKDKKPIMIIATIALALVESIMSISGYNFLTASGIFKYLALNLLPILAKHFLLSYLSYNVGIKIQLIYRLPVDLLIYFLPIVPNYGDYLTCVKDLLPPLITYNVAFNIINKREYVEKDFKVKKYGLVDAILLSIFIILFCITSGVFNLELKVIVSNSMAPAIRRGDDILIKKLTDKDKLEKNDIVGFNYNNKLTFHRIVEIEKINDTVYYHTKGDNNDIEDSISLTRKDIVSKVIIKIPYLGYPNVLIDEYRRK